MPRHNEKKYKSYNYSINSLNRRIDGLEDELDDYDKRKINDLLGYAMGLIPYVGPYLGFMTMGHNAQIEIAKKNVERLLDTFVNAKEKAYRNGDKYATISFTYRYRDWESYFEENRVPDDDIEDAIEKYPKGWIVVSSKCTKTY